MYLVKSSVPALTISLPLSLVIEISDAYAISYTNNSARQICRIALI